MKVIQAIGIDAAFSNMGFARVSIDVSGPKPIVSCTDLNLTTTEGNQKKEVRKSSDELRRARELYAAMTHHCHDVQLVFVEVPSGSQSAAASRCLGIVVGVLAACQQSIIEVSPMEVKTVVTGTRDRKVKATKANVIEWAVKLWPDAPWLRFQGKPTGRILAANEHLADALATVMAGIATPQFKQLLQLVKPNAPSSPNSVGPAPDSRTRRRVSLVAVPVDSRAG